MWTTEFVFIGLALDFFTQSLETRKTLHEYSLNDFYKTICIYIYIYLVDINMDTREKDYYFNMLYDEGFLEGIIKPILIEHTDCHRMGAGD